MILFFSILKNGWRNSFSNFRRWRRVINPNFNLNANSIDFILSPDYTKDYQTVSTKKWRYYETTTKNPTIQDFLEFCDFWYNEPGKEKQVFKSFNIF